MLSNIYPTLLLSGTATGLRISSVAAGAFFDNAPAELMTEIAKYPIVCLDIMDGSALLRAYTGSSKVGTGETLGAEKITNTTFDADTTGWTAVGSTIASIAGGQSNNCLELTKAGVTQAVRSNDASSGNAGKLYCVTGYVKSGTSGNEQFSFAVDGYDSLTALGTSSGSWVQYTKYATSIQSGGTFFLTIKKIGTTAGTMLFDEVSEKQVTAPSTSGCLLYNSRAMTTQSLLVNTFTAANYNKSSYTYKLWGMFKTSGRGGYVR